MGNTRILASGTDDTPLGKRKQKVPQKRDETGNIAAILLNPPTLCQISTSSGLILIALFVVLELNIGRNMMDIAEQVGIL